MLFCLIVRIVFVVCWILQTKLCLGPLNQISNCPIGTLFNKKFFSHYASYSLKLTLVKYLELLSLYYHFAALYAISTTQGFCKLDRRLHFLIPVSANRIQ